MPGFNQPETARLDTGKQVPRIVSGGQTGADRGALDAALEAGVPCGGWCPFGRLAEDGRIGDRYPLRETDSAEYSERTRWNVRDCDGTLVLTKGKSDGGTELTIRLAGEMGKPFLVISPDDNAGRIAQVEEWIREFSIAVLNIAGPRESCQPGIYEASFRFVRRLIRSLSE